MNLPRHRTVRSRDLDLAVWERGDTGRPTIVLVHGYPDSHHVWEGVAAILAERFHVVTYDVRGAGESNVPSSRAGYDLSLLVADLATVAAATCPDEPIHLVGHDWGSVQSWEAVAGPDMPDRIASFTTLSGPCLDHAADWLRANRGRPAFRRQAAHSWYIAAFQLPALAPLFWRTLGKRAFGRYLARSEGAVTPRHPAPTLPRDGANGVNLYRQNIPERIARPQGRTTDVPVQLIVATQDRFLTTDVFDDVEDYCDEVTRRTVDAGHWFFVGDPDRLADWIGEHVDAHPADQNRSASTSS